MKRLDGLLGWLMPALLGAGSPLAGASDPTNLVFILADDLGYGELGCYGQRVIKTPRLDRMAAEGLRFTQFYAGSTVCAPSRCVLMTGRHLGHAHVRGNASGLAQSLRDEDLTVAEVLRGAGYATALIGKWGLGETDQPGHPLRQGFDFFYGYLNQVHAHNYYPEFLWRNLEPERLQNVVQTAKQAYGGFAGGWATKRVEYSHDRFAAEALRWIRERKDGPFFLYLAWTIPHANNEGSAGTGNGAEVPDFGPYAGTDWPDPDKGQAAMITRMDGDVGRLLDLLQELGIAERTLVFFSSDNGPHNEARHDLKRFNPSGPLRGIKRDLYEGGIRVPMIAWWPGTVKPGGVSDHLGYFGDLLGILRAGLEAGGAAGGLEGRPEADADGEDGALRPGERRGRVEGRRRGAPGRRRLDGGDDAGGPRPAPGVAGARAEKTRLEMRSLPRRLPRPSGLSPGRARSAATAAAATSGGSFA